MIGEYNARKFVDGLIADLAVNHSFYGISYKEYIDPDSQIAPNIKQLMLINRKDFLNSRIWQYRISFIKDGLVFCEYTIAEEISDEHMRSKKDTVSSIREFFKESSLDQIWEIALQQLMINAIINMHAIAHQQKLQQDGTRYNVAIPPG